MTLRARLVLSAAYLLVAVVVALEVPLWLNIERRATAEFESGVLGNAAILASRISNLVAERSARSANGPELTRVVAATARTLRARVLLTDGTGDVIADSSGIAAPGARYATPQRPEFTAGLFEGRIDVRRRFSEELEQELLLVTIPVLHRGGVVGSVRVSESMASIKARVRRSWLGLGAIGAGAVALGLALAWFLAGSLVRPVRALGDAAVRLGEGDLNARAVPEGPAEIATLARTFNRMAEVLSANLAAQSDFLANASHQLRTPLTGLRLRLETIKTFPGPAEEQAAKAEGEVDRLTRLVDGLLKLTRASSLETTGATVDLDEAARAAVERWDETAAASGVELRLQAGSHVLAWADPADLGDALDNLIDNAIRYCPPGSQIVAGAGADDDGHPKLSVADTGPGLPPEDRPRAFERFYRGANGRRAGPGTGLGLAIVAELARRWGGEVRLAEGAGMRVEIVFPSATGT
ncbi:MAG: HAMP domain-containing histidine kinase [Actinobacteria bacterium]|nr:HAMP domain-containing histidine kinase [Actinomycetota bacterium]